MLLALLLTANAQDTFRWDWDTDLPVTVAAGATFGALYTQVEPNLTPFGQIATRVGIDDTGLTKTDERAAAASDVLLYGGLGAAAVAAAVDGVADDESAGTRLLLLSEAFAVNGAITETLKLAVRRPRPYTAFEGADAELLAEVDSEMSFPSGHTSFTAAAAFTTARMYHLSGATPAEAALGYGAATALTATVGTLRVTAGRHHPSDVVTGALIGAAVGWVVPSMHRAPVQVVPAPGGVGVTGTF